MQGLPSAAQRLMQIYHDQPLHMGDKNRYYLAARIFQEETGLKSPFSNYDSFKASKKRLIKG